jgi:tight adherence protein C
MSELFLNLGLVGIFGAVVSAILLTRALMLERRRGMEVLRAQVVELPDVRRQTLSQPFTERALLPFVSGMGQLARRLTPIGMRDRIARLLVLGGNPPTDADKIAALKVFGSIGAAVGGIALGVLAGLSGLPLLGGAVVAALLAYLLPGGGIRQRALNRQEAIRRALPDTMDLLTISVEAGLGFDAALAHVRKNVKGPLSDEIGRMLQELQLGASRADVFRQLGDRSDVQELKAFSLAMVQADQFGISVSKVLRSQAADLRIRRRQRAEEKALKVPVKLLFPVIAGFLPAMFVVIVGPGVIQLSHSLFF